MRSDALDKCHIYLQLLVICHASRRPMNRTNIHLFY